MNFMNAVKNELVEGDNNVSVTENGALGYRTTGKALLDLNFAVSSLRHECESAIESMFAYACAENLQLAITWLFMARDIRGSGTGMGERRLFRICFGYLCREWPDIACSVLPLIPFYGRWDDLIDLVFTAANKKVKDAAFSIVRQQLEEDYEHAKSGKSVSLCAKWCYSENASAKETIERAAKLREMLGMTPRYYRKMLSLCRKQADVVERKMSANEWGEINYEAVPSKANLLYKDAFLAHDPNRRSRFLESLEKGEAKINAGTLFPHEIVSKYDVSRWTRRGSCDASLEALWNALPNTIPEGGSVLVVADGSGSMCSNSNNGPRPLDVANALAIYFSERLPEPWKNQYITFSSRPQLVDLSGANTLYGKLRIALEHDECSNTNIERTFELILSTAIRNNLKQDELPKNILIISDMEFDAATGSYGYYGYENRKSMSTLFDTVAQRFAEHGYKLPRLVFWNVNSRTGTIPVKENELGVALVSGYSPQIANMVMSAKLDPYECLLETLADKRYDPVRAALAND